MLKIITTVGTSLFLNLDDEFDAGIKATWRSLQKEPGDRWEEKGGNDHDGEDSEIGSIRSFCSQPGFQALFSDSECSAETATLEKIIDETTCGEAYEVYLLCTDTVLSRLAAELLAVYSPILKHKTRVIDSDGKPLDIPEGKVVKKVSIEDAQVLRIQGLTHLVAEIQAIWRLQFNCRNSDAPDALIINASGGYKGIIPFLTLIAQLYDIPMYYKYKEDDGDRNNSSHVLHPLIKIDSVPFGFNRELIYEIAPYLEQGRIENASQDPRIKEIIDEMHVMHLLDEEAKLTDVGLMLKAFYDGAGIEMIEEVDRNTPAGKYRSDAASALTEFKFFEWRSMIPYASKGRQYALASRSSGNKHNLQLKKHKVLFNSQIDIVMESVDGDGYVLGEIKYAYWVGYELAKKHKTAENPHATDDDIRKTAQNADKLIKQIRTRLQECDHSLPNEFHIYAYSVLPMDENDKERLIKRIKKIDQAFRDKPEYADIRLKAFYGSLGADAKKMANTSVDDFNSKIKEIYSSEQQVQ